MNASIASRTGEYQAPSWIRSAYLRAVSCFIRSRPRGLTKLSSSRCAMWSTAAAGASQTTRELLPASRCSTMSRRPTPWAPAIVPTLATRSTKGIAIPFTATGAPASNWSSMQAGAPGHSAGPFVSV